jgi:hypothetical protein
VMDRLPTVGYANGFMRIDNFDECDPIEYSSRHIGSDTLDPTFRTSISRPRRLDN